MLHDHWKYLTTAGKYPGIDLLRAIAVSAVVLYHFDFLPIGWVGVDLFFVLSGFLIGGAIISANEMNRFSFRRFYGHRALRIIPVYYFSIFCYVIIYLISGGAAFNWRSIVLPILFLQTTVPYFFGIPVFEPVVPEGSWSLAIEEQFYLIAPLVLFGAIRAFGRIGAAGVALLAVLAAVPVRYIMMSDFDPVDPNWHFASFIQFHSRFDELAVGVLVAAILPYVRVDRVAREILGLVFVMVFCVFLASIYNSQNFWIRPYSITRDTIWIPTFLAFSFGGAVFLLYDATVRSILVVILARLSYPLYLFHLTFIVAFHSFPEHWSVIFARNAFSQYGLNVILIAGSLLIAYLVSLLIEFPFLRMYKRSHLSS